MSMFSNLKMSQDQSDAKNKMQQTERKAIANSLKKVTKRINNLVKDLEDSNKILLFVLNDASQFDKEVNLNMFPLRKHGY